MLVMTDLAASGQKVTAPSTSVYSINGWFVVGLICFVYVFFNWYLQTQVLTDQLYTYSLGRFVNPDKLSAFLEGQHRMFFLSYLMLFVNLGIRMLLVSTCLLAGLLLTSQKLPFRTLYRIVLFAESAFVAGVLFRLLVLAFSRDMNSLGHYLHFAPLSLYSFFPPDSVPVWLIYPLQTLDLFQAGYIFLLAAGIQHFMGKPLKKSLKLVLGSYGIGLLCWMIAVAFVTVSLNP